MSGDKQVNYLELSDEELMNMPPPPIDLSGSEDYSNGAEETNQDDEVDSKKQDGESPAENASADAEEDTDEKEAGDASDEDAGEEDDSEDKDSKSAKADADEASKAEADEKPKSEEEKNEENKETPVNYEAEYKKLMAPFKANGKEITPKSVEDAIALMQMGANYNKKMAALKPNLRLLKMLENNGLLDEGKLSFLIDVDKKSPEAISKLIKDSGLDPMDLDADKASGYKGNSYSVDEKEIELDQVLDELQGTPAYSRTLEIVANKWDSASKQILAQQPALLKVINDHVERGIYDIIQREMDNERLFGRLNGMSELEAYRYVGDMIQARGGFNHLAGPQRKSEPEAKTVVPPKPSKDSEDKLMQKRRAASPTRTSPAKKTDPDFNPLALSDDEFSKLVNSKYL